MVAAHICEACRGWPSVVEAWSLVMEDVGAVRKDSVNQSQGFSFRGVDAVVNAVGPALRRHGCVIVPYVEAANYREVEVGQRRTIQRECTVKVRYVVMGPSGDQFEGCVYAEALDSGDKATAKAHSVAHLCSCGAWEWPEDEFAGGSLVDGGFRCAECLA